VGYSGGKVLNPNYEIVKIGTSGHAEAIEVVFNPQKLSYSELLSYFFRLHDPTTLNRQGNDKGTQYRSAIFYHSKEQNQIAKEYVLKLETSKKWKNPIVTEITPFEKFYPAEEYHQDYLVKNPGGYTCHWLRE
jgi:methionine-S-sulfoxide reductase